MQLRKKSARRMDSSEQSSETPQKDLFKDLTPNPNPLNAASSCDVSTAQTQPENPRTLDQIESEDDGEDDGEIGQNSLPRYPAGDSHSHMRARRTFASSEDFVMHEGSYSEGGNGHELDDDCSGDQYDGFNTHGNNLLLFIGFCSTLRLGFCSSTFPKRMR